MITKITSIGLLVHVKCEMSLFLVNSKNKNDKKTNEIPLNLPSDCCILNPAELDLLISITSLCIITSQMHGTAVVANTTHG